MPNFQSFCKFLACFTCDNQEHHPTNPRGDSAGPLFPCKVQDHNVGCNVISFHGAPCPGLEGPVSEMCTEVDTSIGLIYPGGIKLYLFSPWSKGGQLPSLLSYFTLFLIYSMRIIWHRHHERKAARTHGSFGDCFTEMYRWLCECCPARLPLAGVDIKRTEFLSQRALLSEHAEGSGKNTPNTQLFIPQNRQLSVLDFEPP